MLSSPNIPYLVVHFLTVGLLAATSLGQVGSFEGNSFPEKDGWERSVDCDPTRRLEAGWFVQDVEVGCGGPPGGDRDRYLMSLESFAGSARFFVEWKVISNGDRSEIIGVGPCSVVTADNFGVNYHFTIASDQVRLIRDNFLPIVFVDVDPASAHTYRLELSGDDEYRWYIDGKLVETGVPEGTYPTETAVISWRAYAWHDDSETRWDFVRYGKMPEDSSGDYDSDGTVSLADQYFVDDCLAEDGPGIFGGPGADAGPGCRFADFDGDSDVDLVDVAEFQARFGNE